MPTPQNQQQPPQVEQSPEPPTSENRAPTAADVDEDEINDDVCDDDEDDDEFDDEDDGDDEDEDQERYKDA